MVPLKRSEVDVVLLVTYMGKIDITITASADKVLHIF